MFSQNDDRDRCRTRFGGYALETLQGLVELGHAAYDEERHCWVVGGKATSDGKPFEVPYVDWHAADAACPGSCHPARCAGCVPSARAWPSGSTTA